MKDADGVRARALWLGALLTLLAVWCVARARYTADLSAFMPKAPDAAAQTLISQLRDGLASRLMLVAVEGDPVSQRAAVIASMAAKLRASGLFVAVADGDSSNAAADQAYLFRHRYTLSNAVTSAHFATDNMAASVAEAIDMLAAPGGFAAKDLVRADPTGETLHLLAQLSPTQAPTLSEGVWASGDGKRALMLLETRGSGADTDAQASAWNSVQAAFDHARLQLHSPGLQLRASGPGIFAVQARSTIQSEALRRSLISAALIVLVLLAVYRSPTLLLLGLLPPVLGALSGVAAVDLGFGIVHGITLGFGITLIGESVDYSIYYFLQVRPGADTPAETERQHALWPTLTLGMLTSAVGFAALLPSSFPGLAQLGLYTVSGLVAALCATRWLLPALTPRRVRIVDLSVAGQHLQAWQQRARLPLWLAGALAAALLLVVMLHRQHLINHDISALSPIPAAQLALDQSLRQDLGAPDAGHLVMVRGGDLETTLRGAELAASALDPLVASHVIAGYTSISNLLPSSATQASRRRALPEAAALHAAVQSVSQQLGLTDHALDEFEAQVQAARSAPDLTMADLAGTSFATLADSLLWHNEHGFVAVLPLQAGNGGDIDDAAVRAALPSRQVDVQLLDTRAETGKLMDGYIGEALRLCMMGLAGILVLLAWRLRSLRRVMRVLIPLLLAVLAVLALLASMHVALNLLHLVGLLLIAAVGSNYALFFEKPQWRTAQGQRTVASLVLANACTLIGIGTLAFSHVPVLQALGATVAPGTALALLFAALLAAPAADFPAEPPSGTISA